MNNVRMNNLFQETLSALLDFGHEDRCYVYLDLLYEGRKLIERKEDMENVSEMLKDYFNKKKEMEEALTDYRNNLITLLHNGIIQQEEYNVLRSID